MYSIITREGNEVIVDEDIYYLIKDRNIYERDNSIFITENKRRIRLVYFILGLENKGRIVYFNNENAYDLRRINLTFTNIKFVLKDNYYECNLPDSTIFLIDVEDKILVEKYAWSLKESGYIFRKEDYNYIYLHKEIVKCYFKETEVDHKSVNKLDNRKNNLRVCSHQENMENKFKANIKNPTSKYKGVSYRKDSNAWCARITPRDKKQINLGIFKTEESAASCYAFYSNLLHGSFGRSDGIINKNWFNDRVYSSKFEIKGVSLHKKTGLIRARIIVNGREKSLGYFKDKITAYKTYNENVIKYNLPFQKLNVLDGDDLMLLENYVKDNLDKFGIDMVEGK